MFLDTSGLFCVHHAGEPEHRDTLNLFAVAGPKLTHGEVLSEFVTLGLARGLPRLSSLAFVRSLLEHPDVEVVGIDAPIHRVGTR